MSEQPKCICGHPKESHHRDAYYDFDHCEVKCLCRCRKFRESAPWPDTPGCYWWKHGNDCEIIYATDFGDEQLSILRVGFEYRLSPETAVRFGPGGFVRLLESSPFPTTAVPHQLTPPT